MPTNGFVVTEIEMGAVVAVRSEVKWASATDFSVDANGYLWIHQATENVGVYPPGTWGPVKALDPTAAGPTTSGSLDSPMSVAADNFAANQASDAPAPWTASEEGPTSTPPASATPPLVTTPEGAIPDSITGVPGADNPAIS